MVDFIELDRRDLENNAFPLPNKLDSLVLDFNELDRRDLNCLFPMGDIINNVSVRCDVKSK